MQNILVEINRDPARIGYTIHASIGDMDVTEHLRGIHMIALRGYLPSDRRNYSNIGRQRYRTLGQYLSNDMAGDNPLPPQVLADAIRAYLTDVAPELTSEGGHVSSTVESDMDIAENLATSQPPLLSIGGRLFRLNPVAESGVPVKLLDRMRTAAVASIQTQRTALIAAATREATIIRRQAEQARALLEMERVQFERTRASDDRFIIPDWLRGSPVIRLDDGRLAVRLEFSFAPVKFTWPQWGVYIQETDDDGEPMGDYTRDRNADIEWDAVPGMEPVIVYFWFKFNPVDGRYNLSNSYMDIASIQLPHAGYNGFCCQPQGLPERIRSGEDLVRVAGAVQRAFRIVNLSSLLIQPESWGAAAKAFAPQGVLDFWEQFKEHGEERTDFDDYGAREVPREQPAMIWAAPATATGDLNDE